MMDVGFSFIASALESSTQGLLSILPSIIGPILFLVMLAIAYKLSTFIVKRLVRRAIAQKVLKREEEVKKVVSIWRYLFIFFALILVIASFSGSIAAAGLSIGLLSAALGWALQKPITGIAAWIMITIKKPFKVGDRVIIQDIQGNVQGDIADITAFYIVLNEFGGTTSGEEQSGRQIMLPTSILFEKPIVNYTYRDKFVLDELFVSVTYESNLNKAKKILMEAAGEETQDIIEKTKKNPYTRVSFADSSVNVKVSYQTNAIHRNKIKTQIAEAIFEKISKAADVEFAYPHTQLVFKQDKPLEFEHRTQYTFGQKKENNNKPNKNNNKIEKSDETIKKL